MENRTAAGVIGGRYRICGLLGEGGMARVFDAFDDRLERSVAVKLMRPETEALPGMRQRFQQEARLAARLVHPNIVAVLDYGEDSSSYLVMERLPGTTLRDEIERGPLSIRRAALVMTETLGALAAAHSFGVLHRDIKPSNILIQDDGHTKLTDFGIAKSIDLRATANSVPDDMTMAGVVLGTPGYLAPERRTGHPATVQSDLYAVGAVMVEALTGQRLAPGADALRAVPPSLRAVAEQALAPQPGDRFLSAGAMLEALRTAPPRRVTGTTAARMAQVGPTPANTAATTRVAPPVDIPRTAMLRPPPDARRRFTRPRRRRYGAAAAAAIVAVALIALVLILGGGSKPSGPSASAASHHGAVRSPPSDPERAAIRARAASLAKGGLPGDGALAGALDTTASQPPGPRRQSAAQQTLVLAQVLLAGGGVSSAQYQGVVSVLQPTGATVPTITLPTTPPPATTPKPPGRGSHDHQGQDAGQGA